MVRRCREELDECQNIVEEDSARQADVETL